MLLPRLLLLVLLVVPANAADATTSATLWHVTDIHLDSRYRAHTNPTRPVGDQCHQGVGNASVWGSYHCDTPRTLLDSALAFLDAAFPSPAALVYTGDSLPHDAYSFFDYAKVIGGIRNVSAALRRTSARVVLQTLGNHDVFPEDAMPPAPGVGPSATLYADVACAWGLSAAQNATFLRGGYYSAEVGGVRVLLLNTILWYAPNNLTASVDDPAGQFAWLEAQLAAAAPQSVLLAGHVAPGVDERLVGDASGNYHAAHNARLVALLQKYAGAVLGGLFGHHHSDSMRVGGAGLPPLLIAPSVTPWLNPWAAGALPNNPAVRVFVLSPEGALDDYAQFWTDLAREAEPPVWRLEYSARDAFNLTSLSGDASGWARFVQRLRDGDASAAWRAYVAHNLVEYAWTCDATCKAFNLCAITHLGLDKLRACVNNSSIVTS